MNTVDQALELIQENIPVFSKGTNLPVSQCENRILSETVMALRDFPVADNSSMDGFIFLRKDIESENRLFPIQFEIRPEHKKTPFLKPGFCARILTGGMVPAQDVVIIPVEQTTINILNELEKKETMRGGGLGSRSHSCIKTQNPSSIKIRKFLQHEYHEEIHVREIPVKDYIRKKGSGYKKGDVLLNARTRLRPYEKGLLISAGIKRVKVLKKLKIGIQNTGNEINSDNNTNGPVLQDLLNTIPGVNVKILSVASDNENRLKTRFKSLLSNFDVIVTTGGISAGNYDFVHSTFEKLGVKFFIRKISQKPGKPVSIGIFKNRPVCCLPGNPMSAVFCTELYLRVLLYKMLGNPFEFITAIAQNEITNKSTLTAFHTGKMYFEEGIVNVKINTDIQSNLLTLYRDSNCYVRVEGGKKVNYGDRVQVLPFIPV